MTGSGEGVREDAPGAVGGGIALVVASGGVVGAVESTGMGSEVVGAVITGGMGDGLAELFFDGSFTSFGLSRTAADFKVFGVTEGNKTGAAG